MDHYLIILVFGYYANITGEVNVDQGIITLWRCPNFEDKRNDGTDQHEITVPSISENFQSRVFRISNAEKNLSCTNMLSVTIDTEKISKPPADLSVVEYRRPGLFGYPVDRPPYFTQDGHVHFNLQFYKPEDYCMKQVSNSYLVLHLCQIKCDDASDQPCLPACCPPEQRASNPEFACWNGTSHEPFRTTTLHSCDLGFSSWPKVDPFRFSTNINLPFAEVRNEINKQQQTGNITGGKYCWHFVESKSSNYPQMLIMEMCPANALTDKKIKH